MLVRFDCRYVHTYVRTTLAHMYVPWTNTKELKAVIMYVCMHVRVVPPSSRIRTWETDQICGF